MDSSGELEKAIGKRGLAVINVRHDRKITNPFGRELAQVEAVFLGQLLPLILRQHKVVAARRQAAALLPDKRATLPPLYKVERFDDSWRGHGLLQ